MKMIELNPKETGVLAGLATFGFLVPNGIFLYFFVTNPEVTEAALQNPIALVFIAEAFFLMLLFAWLLNKAGIRKPSGLVFIIMSLLGSMVFSVPAALYLMLKNKKTE